MYQHQTDLSPIEVAIDEMSAKVGELRLLCSAPEVDMIRLQLKLQGSISVQVRRRDAPRCFGGVRLLRNRVVLGSVTWSFFGGVFSGQRRSTCVRQSLPRRR